MGTKTALAELAQESGMAFDQQAGVVYGRVGGHSMSMTSIEGTNCVEIVVSVQKDGRGATIEEVTEYFKGNKLVTKHAVNGNRIVFSHAGAINLKKSYEKAREAAREIASFLTTKGYVDCCDSCGVDSGFSTCVVNGQGISLCDDCFQRVSQNLEGNKQAVARKKGSILTGIVGALIGSIIGAASIVIVGQMGYVAALTGIIMAVSTLKGYELLGGKLDIIGIIISSIIMLVMVFVGNNLDWALLVVKEFEDVTIFEAFAAIPSLIEAEAIEFGSYIQNLLMVYLFTVVGAFPTIRSIAKTKSGSYEARKAA